MNRLLPKPKIRLDDRFAPSWIGWFTLSVTFGWFCYGTYQRVLWPLFQDESPMQRYIEREFPELDVFERRGETGSHSTKMFQIPKHPRD